MIKINNHEYKVVLLDTNVISNIVKNDNKSLYSFFNMHLNSFWITTLQNIIEIKNSPDTYEKFCNIFSRIPIRVFKHFRILISQDFNIMNSFYEFERKGLLYNVKEKIENELFNNENNYNNILLENKEIGELCKMWNQQKKDMDIFKNYSLKDYTDKVEKNTVINSLKTFNINDTDYEKFPGIRLFCYTMFDRIFKQNKAVKIGDIRDSLISIYLPYADVLYTENHQYEVIKQAKRFIKEITNVEIHRVSELYN